MRSMWLRVFLGCLWIGMAVTARAGEFGILKYSDNGETLSITGVRAGPTEPVVIPAEIDGKPVTAINDNAFQNCSSMPSITIPVGVTTIGKDAFGYCNSLVSVTVPVGVVSIGESAFANCLKLKQVTIPGGVVSIGDSMFQQCGALEQVSLPDGLTAIGDYAFGGCVKLTGVTFPNSLTSIGNGAFDGCHGITEVVIPDDVTLLGGSAFQGCEGLQKVVMGKAVKTIEPNTFARCFALKEVTLQEGLTWIKDRAFEWCGKLERVKIPSSVGSIGYAAFSTCERLKEVEIGKGLVLVDGLAFENCVELRSLTMPATLKWMYWNVFENCRKLDVITFLGNAPDVDETTFRGVSPAFKVRYYEGRKGFKIWNGYWEGVPAEMIMLRPEIQVEQPLGTTVGEGQDRRWLGRQELGSRSEPMYFTIRNLGEKPLTGMAVKVTGAHAKDFIVLGERKKLAGRASMKFRVIFKPRAEGLRQAMLRIRSDDADEPMIDVELQGEGRKKRSW